MTTQKDIDVQKLRVISKESPAAKAMFEYFDSRKRGRQDTSFRRLRRMLNEQGVKLKSDEIAAVFKKLEDLGAGKLVLGRNKKPNRFVWGFNLRSIVKAAQGKATAVDRQAPTKVRLPEVEGAAPAPATNGHSKPAGIKVSNTGSTIKVKRGDFEIEMPTNLTDAEAERVGKILSHLPIAS